MILGLSLLLSAVVSAPAPATAADLQALCIAAVDTDATSRDTCLGPILAAAAPMKIEPLDESAVTSCLTVPTLADDELIWIFLDWMQERPDAGAKKADVAVNAALLDKLPCGWQQP